MRKAHQCHWAGCIPLSRQAGEGLQRSHGSCGVSADHCPMDAGQHRAGQHAVCSCQTCRAAAPPLAPHTPTHCRGCPGPALAGAPQEVNRAGWAGSSWGHGQPGPGVPSDILGTHRHPGSELPRAPQAYSLHGAFRGTGTSQGRGAWGHPGDTTGIPGQMCPATSWGTPGITGTS